MQLAAETENSEVVEHIRNRTNINAFRASSISTYTIEAAVYHGSDIMVRMLLDASVHVKIGRPRKQRFVIAKYSWCMLVST